MSLNDPWCGVCNKQTVVGSDGVCFGCAQPQSSSSASGLSENAGKSFFFDPRDFSWLNEAPEPEKSEVFQKAYEARFDQVAELNALWTRAAKGDNRYKSVRRKFWRLVNNDPSYEAHFVRELMLAAGCELGSGSNAPRLQMEWDTESETRMHDARSVSLDHAAPKSKEKHLATAASNIRFMMFDDNRFRGNRRDANEKLYIPEDPRIAKYGTPEERREKQEFRDRVEKMLLDRKESDFSFCGCCNTPTRNLGAGGLCAPCAKLMHP